MPPLTTLLGPWEFSPTVLFCSLGAAGLFARGMIARRHVGGRTGFWRATSFFLGLLLTYAALQTYLDYLSQHMFWVHRFQHLILHHLGPFLIMLAVPHEIMRDGLPGSLRDRVLRPLWHSRWVHWPYRLLQSPLIAAPMFVGLIYFWLRPAVHFDAMLSAPLYRLMNWSMVVDGLLFWWLMIDPRPPQKHRTLGFAIRVLMLWGVMVPQIMIGAHIALAQTELFDVYAVCGRAWPVPPVVDQELGGLITWIPAAMMSVIAALVVLRLWVVDNTRRNAERDAQLAVDGILPERAL